MPVVSQRVLHDNRETPGGSKRQRQTIKRGEILGDLSLLIKTVQDIQRPFHPRSGRWQSFTVKNPILFKGPTIHNPTDCPLPLRDQHLYHCLKIRHGSNRCFEVFQSHVLPESVIHVVGGVQSIHDFENA